MTAEAMAFAALGVAVLVRVHLPGVAKLLIAMVAWNAVHVAVFYLALLFAEHWTWLHTLLMTIALAAATASIVWIIPDPSAEGARGLTAHCR